MTAEQPEQSFVGKLLDRIFPPPYGFCQHPIGKTRASCKYFRNNMCHLWADTEGAEPYNDCTGRRP
jgi:hypothetical protein